MELNYVVFLLLTYSLFNLGFCQTNKLMNTRQGPPRFSSSSIRRNIISPNDLRVPTNRFQLQRQRSSSFDQNDNLLNLDSINNLNDIADLRHIQMERGDNRFNIDNMNTLSLNQRHAHSENRNTNTVASTRRHEHSDNRNTNTLSSNQRRAHSDNRNTNTLSSTQRHAHSENRNSNTLSPNQRRTHSENRNANAFLSTRVHANSENSNTNPLSSTQRRSHSDNRNTDMQSLNQRHAHFENEDPNTFSPNQRRAHSQNRNTNTLSSTQRHSHFENRNSNTLSPNQRRAHIENRNTNTLSSTQRHAHSEKRNLANQESDNNNIDRNELLQLRSAFRYLYQRGELPRGIMINMRNGRPQLLRIDRNTQASHSFSRTQVRNILRTLNRLLTNHNLSIDENNSGNRQIRIENDRDTGGITEDLSNRHQSINRSNLRTTISTSSNRRQMHQQNAETTGRATHARRPQNRVSSAGARHIQQSSTRVGQSLDDSGLSTGDMWASESGMENTRVNHAIQTEHHEPPTRTMVILRTPANLASNDELSTNVDSLQRQLEQEKALLVNIRQREQSLIMNGDNVHTSSNNKATHSADLNSDISRLMMEIEQERSKLADMKHQEELLNVNINGPSRTLSSTDSQLLADIAYLQTLVSGRQQQSVDLGLTGVQEATANANHNHAVTIGNNAVNQQNTHSNADPNHIVSLLQGLNSNQMNNQEPNHPVLNSVGSNSQGMHSQGLANPGMNDIALSGQVPNSSGLNNNMLPNSPGLHDHGLNNPGLHDHGLNNHGINNHELGNIVPNNKLAPNSQGMQNNMAPNNPGLNNNNPGLHNNMAPNNPGLNNNMVPNNPGLHNSIVPNNPGLNNNMAPNNPALNNNMVPNNQGLHNNVVPNNQGLHNNVVPNNQGLHNNMAPNNLGLHNNMAPNNPGLHNMMPPNIQGLNNMMPPNIQGLNNMMPPNIQGLHNMMPPNVQGHDIPGLNNPTVNQQELNNFPLPNHQFLANGHLNNLGNSPFTGGHPLFGHGLPSEFLQEMMFGDTTDPPDPTAPPTTTQPTPVTTPMAVTQATNLSNILPVVSQHNPSPVQHHVINTTGGLNSFLTHAPGGLKILIQLPGTNQTIPVILPQIVSSHLNKDLTTAQANGNTENGSITLSPNADIQMKPFPITKEAIQIKTMAGVFEKNATTPTDLNTQLTNGGSPLLSGFNLQSNAHVPIQQVNEGHANGVQVAQIVKSDVNPHHNDNVISKVPVNKAPDNNSQMFVHQLQRIETLMNKLMLTTTQKPITTTTMEPDELEGEEIPTTTPAPRRSHQEAKQGSVHIPANIPPTAYDINQCNPHLPNFGCEGVGMFKSVQSINAWCVGKCVHHQCIESVCQCGCYVNSKSNNQAHVIGNEIASAISGTTNQSATTNNALAELYNSLSSDASTKGFAVSFVQSPFGVKTTTPPPANDVKTLLASIEKLIEAKLSKQSHGSNVNKPIRTDLTSGHWENGRSTTWSPARSNRWHHATTPASWSFQGRNHWQNEHNRISK